MVVVNETSSARYQGQYSTALKRRRSSHIKLDDQALYEKLALSEDIFKKQPAIAAALLSAWEREEMKLKQKPQFSNDNNYVTLCAPNKISRTVSTLENRTNTRFNDQPTVSKQGSPALNKCAIRSVKASTTEKYRILESPIFLRIRKGNVTSRILSDENTEEENTEDSFDCAEKTCTTLTPSKRHSLSTWIKRRSSIGINTKSRSKETGKRRTSLSPAIKTEDQFMRSQAFKQNELSGKSDVHLEDVLCHKIGRRLFHNFLKKEFSDENLEFWVECENFKTLSNTKQSKHAAKIYQKYVAENSPMEVNIDGPTRTFLAADVTCPSSEMFNEAQRQIFKLMQLDSFPRFVSFIRENSE